VIFYFATEINSIVLSDPISIIISEMQKEYTSCEGWASI